MIHRQQLQLIERDTAATVQILTPFKLADPHVENKLRRRPYYLIGLLAYELLPPRQCSQSSSQRGASQFV